MDLFILDRPGESIAPRLPLQSSNVVGRKYRKKNHFGLTHCEMVCRVTAGARRRTSTLYGTVPAPITVKTVYNSHRH